VAQQRATGSVAPQEKAGGWRCPIDIEILKTVVREAPDSTVAELCWEYNRRVPAAQRTNERRFRRVMGRVGFVQKKDAGARANSTGRMWRQSGPRS
jgi:hypothetical protein